MLEGAAHSDSGFELLRAENSEGHKEGSGGESTAPILKDVDSLHNFTGFALQIVRSTRAAGKSKPNNEQSYLHFDS
jgi:hypothetical protein